MTENYFDRFRNYLERNLSYEVTAIPRNGLETRSTLQAKITLKERGLFPLPGTKRRKMLRRIAESRAEIRRLPVTVHAVKGEKRDYIVKDHSIPRS